MRYLSSIVVRLGPEKLLAPGPCACRWALHVGFIYASPLSLAADADMLTEYFFKSSDSEKLYSFFFVVFEGFLLISCNFLSLIVRGLSF